MQEITSVSKKKTKRIFRLTPDEFRSGKWCADKEMVPDGQFVELTFTARNGILIVHNTTDLHVKKIDDSVKLGDDEDE